MITRLLVSAALILGGYWTLLFFLQRRVMFPAPGMATTSPPPADAQQVWLPGHRGNTEAWYLPPTRPGRDPAPLTIFAHGNGELIDYWPDAFDEPRGSGLAVLLVEFPGYGRSAGKPSQASIERAFVAAYDWATGRLDVDTTRVVGYGRSLGGGAVALLSQRRPLAALVLESTFTSTLPFARSVGLPGILVRDPLDNLTAVRRFDGPVLVLHGERDEIIPPNHGRALAEAANTRVHLLPCGHNDCSRPWPVIQEFLVTHTLLPQSDE